MLDTNVMYQAIEIIQHLKSTVWKVFITYTYIMCVIGAIWIYVCILWFIIVYIRKYVNIKLYPSFSWHYFLSFRNYVLTCNTCPYWSVSFLYKIITDDIMITHISQLYKVSAFIPNLMFVLLSPACISNNSCVAYGGFCMISMLKKYI